MEISNCDSASFVSDLQISCVPSTSLEICDICMDFRINLSSNHPIEVQKVGVLQLLICDQCLADVLLFVL